MEAIKIVLFLYTIASAVFLSESTRRLYYEPALSQDDKCICYPHNELYTSVPEMLNSQSDLHRLVLYVYKDVDTNEIKMYTPNSRKQNMIPDLPFEIGDGLVPVNDEKIKDIFDTRRNKVHKVLPKTKKTKTYFKNNDPQDVVRDVTVTPIGMETGQVEEIYHDAHVKNDAVVVAVPKSYKKKSAGSDGMWSGINDLDVGSYPVRKPWHSEVNAQWGDDAPFNWYVDEWGTNTEIRRDLDAVTKKPKAKSKQTVQPTVFPTYGLDVIPSMDDNQFLTFDEWFVKQMKGFENVNLPGDIETINTLAFRMLVQKLLIENNMYVTNDGVLTDSKGNVVDTSNLELRPMLLGNPVESEKVLSGKTSNLKLPKDLPYLEGILVTLIYPPKVLGIIPLGKTTLAQVSDHTYQTWTRIVEAPKPSTIRPHGGGGTRIRTSDLPTKSQKKSVLTTKKRPVIKHEYLAQKSKNKDNVKNLSKLKVPSDVENDQDDTKAQSRRLIAGNFLKTLYDMLSARRGYEYGPDDDDFPYRGYETYEEIPDFRIIGGNAATSSGAPVNNKGRSGDIIIN